MRTPAGKECRYYYEDFHRGRNLQECRLIKENRDNALPWKPVDCSSCLVPDILNANSSRYLELKLSIKPRLLGLGRKLELSAFCTRHKIEIPDAFVGCPPCNAERPGLDVFREALQQDDD